MQTFYVGVCPLFKEQYEKALKVTNLCLRSLSQRNMKKSLNRCVISLLAKVLIITSTWIFCSSKFIKRENVQLFIIDPSRKQKQIDLHSIPNSVCFRCRKNSIVISYHQQFQFVFYEFLVIDSRYWKNPKLLVHWSWSLWQGSECVECISPFLL